jgi:hypothetical protein
MSNDKNQKKARRRTDNKKRENTFTNKTQPKTKQTITTTTLKEGLKRMCRTYAEATRREPAPECTLDNPREQDGTKRKTFGQTPDENEDEMEAPDEWTLVAKKPRRTPTGPESKKPVTTNSDCTLDIPREHDELALEEAHPTEKDPFPDQERAVQSLAEPQITPIQSPRGK